MVEPELVHTLLTETAWTVYELLCALAVATGARRGDILALRWTDIDADFSALRVVRTLQPTQTGLMFEEPKTPRSRRSVMLPDFVAPTW